MIRSPRRNTSAKLKTQLGKMDDHWQVLKHCHGSMDSQRWGESKTGGPEMFVFNLGISQLQQSASLF